MEPMLGAAKADANLIKESTGVEAFMADVIDASHDQPVIVDFWAPWCGPCKQLAPALEKAVKEAKGAVKLVKVNIDQDPEIAQQMRIQSIPAVYAFKAGRPVDGFVGAVPESQVKTFVQRLGGAKGPSPIDEALEQAKAAFDAGDAATASAIYGQVLAHEAGNVPATAGLARCYVAAGDVEKAKQLLAGLSADAAKDKDIVAVRTAIELAEQAQGAGEIGELAAKVAHEPGNHQARLDLAIALFGAARQEEAIDHLLESFKRDRNWNDAAARKQLVKFFEALGNTHALTVAGRKRLSSLMFA